MASKSRQGVTEGGLFNSYKATYSKETQQLLKLMMDESKLTTLQQKKINQVVQSGESLPVSSPCKKVKEPRRRPQVLTGRSLSGGVRSKETIDVIEAENKLETPFRPTATKYIGEKGKERLQNRMAFGRDLPEIETCSSKRRAPEEELEIDRFGEVLQEIEERRQFLEEMVTLGKGKMYRTKIATEISQKIRELEEIDKARSIDLQAQLQTKGLDES